MSFALPLTRLSLALVLTCAMAGCNPPNTPEPQADESTSEQASAGVPLPNVPAAPVGPPSIERSIGQLMGGSKPSSVKPTVLPGLMEVVVNGNVFYMDKEGKYLVHGDLVEVATQKNLTDNTRDVLRSVLMHKLNPKDAIVFKASGKTKHVLNVFTDVECGYCKAFHKNIQAYNNQGYEVRYYAWPRSGTSGPVYDEMVSVWCAKDRRAALTASKDGVRGPKKTCANNHVAEQFALGRELGINGTPAVFLDNGKQLGGYVPPENIDAAVAAATAPPAG